VPRQGKDDIAARDPDSAKRRRLKGFSSDLETPDKGEISRAVDGSLEALGLEGREAVRSRPRGPERGGGRVRPMTEIPLRIQVIRDRPLQFQQLLDGVAHTDGVITGPSVLVGRARACPSTSQSA